MALGRMWVVASLAGMAALTFVAGSASADQTIPVTETEFAFDPSTINVRAGEVVHFDVNNAGRFGHTMHIEGNGLVADSTPGGASLDPGQSTTFDVTFPAPGTYPFWCTLPNHRERGMEGTIVVAAASAAPTQLPRTGDLREVGPALGGLGAGLVGLGLLLRRRLAHR